MMETARSQSKCQEIMKTYNPEKFQIQGYLKSNKFTWEYQQVLFALRTKSYPLKIYFCHQFEDMVCRICLQKNTVEDLLHTICCEELRKYHFDDQLNINQIYGSVSQQYIFRKFFHRARETILETQKQ